MKHKDPIVKSLLTELYHCHRLLQCLELCILPFDIREITERNKSILKAMEDTYKKTGYPWHDSDKEVSK